MGILKVGIGAAKSVLEDTWREYFYCPSMEADVLAKKGQNRKSKRSFNTKGSDNLISNGSIIAVNEGQAMIIVDQGAIVEFCAEAGEFLYDSSTEPSIFYGKLGENILASFKQFGRRVGFGGDTGKDQRVYFFNTKDIMGNKYGTANPVPFRVVDTNIGLDIDISIRCHGEYSYNIIDPILFYKNICGNSTGTVHVEDILPQMGEDLLTYLLQNDGLNVGADHGYHHDGGVDRHLTEQVAHFKVFFDDTLNAADQRGGNHIEGDRDHHDDKDGDEGAPVGLGVFGQPADQLRVLHVPVRLLRILFPFQLNVGNEKCHGEGADDGTDDNNGKVLNHGRCLLPLPVAAALPFSDTRRRFPAALRGGQRPPPCRRR